MAHRQDTGRMMRPSPLVVALALLIVTVAVVIGVVRSLGTGGVDVPQVELPAPVVNPPVVSSTPKPTPTSAPTATPTPTPTATPTPRLWTREQYEEFMFGDASMMYSQVFLLFGWNRYDGIELLDDFPCFFSCYENYAESRQVVMEVFEHNNDADYWCEWACQAVANDFGQPYIRQYEDYDHMRRLFGNVGTEPYCPQFADPFFKFSCDQPTTVQETVPLVSLGWSEETRSRIENTFLYPILPGWVSSSGRFPGWNWPQVFDNTKKEWVWTAQDMEALPDSLVCWIIANGHYYYGFPQYDLPRSTRDWSGRHALRMKLRDWLNRELGEPTNGNPPLCPGFLDMIEPANVP